MQNNDRPFFIVGCGRSGTTLLRMLLNRHPDVAIPLESLFIVDYLKAASQYNLDYLTRLIVREPEIREWGITVSLEDLQGCESITAVIVRLHRFYLQAQGKTRWGQKTPRFIRNMDLLRNHFPGARFIHLVRDPRAVASSLIQSDVHHSNAYLASLRWRMDVAMGLDFERRHPHQVLRIRYEDLVRDSEASTKALLSFLQLPPAPLLQREESEELGEYSDFYRNIHANLERPLTDQFIDKWRSLLSPVQLACVEAITGELMEPLGYRRELPEADISRRYRTIMRLDRLVGLLLQTRKYVLHRGSYLSHLLWRKWKLGLLRKFLCEVNF